MAPLRKVSLGSGTTRSASIFCSKPRPEQVGAGAEGIVEREQPRLDLRDSESGNRACEFLGEHDAFCFAPVVLFIRELDNRDPFRQLQRRLETLRQPCGNVRTHDDAVDDHVDVVVELLVEHRRVGDFRNRSRRCGCAGSPSSCTLRFPCGTRPSGRARLAPAGTGASSPAKQAPGPTICCTVWLSIGRPVAGE